MTGPKNRLAALFAACGKNDALKARFMADPKVVLAEYDMPMPDAADCPCCVVAWLWEVVASGCCTGRREVVAVVVVVASGGGGGE